MAGEEANLAKNMLDKMQVHEVVLAGALERPLHHAEQLLDVTLRWGSWPETDRHDKYLLLKTNQFYQEVLPCALPPLLVFAEVQFSDNKNFTNLGLRNLFRPLESGFLMRKNERKGLISKSLLLLILRLIFLELSNNF